MSKNTTQLIVALVCLAGIFLLGFFLGQKFSKDKDPVINTPQVIEYNNPSIPANIEIGHTNTPIPIPVTTVDSSGEIVNIQIVNVNEYEIAKMDTVLVFPNNSKLELNISYNELKNEFSLASKYQFSQPQTAQPISNIGMSDRARVKPFLAATLSNYRVDNYKYSFLGLALGLKYKGVGLGILADSRKSLGCIMSLDLSF